MFLLTHPLLLSFVFFFNDTATTEIYTLSLHDALPIYFCSCRGGVNRGSRLGKHLRVLGCATRQDGRTAVRSEEHTSELQSQSNLVCRLLLEKKKRADSCSSARQRQPSAHLGV